MLSIRILALAAGALLSLGTSLGSAGAATFDRGQRASDRNLRFVRHNLERIIDNLQNDRRDYAGHRVAAIGDLQAARADVTAALAYDRSHENALPVAGSTVPGVVAAPDLRSGRGSDFNLRRMSRVIEIDIDRLQRDQEDYGGLRVKAIGELHQAREQIEAAIIADRGH
jgi:hypothetical protein